MNRKTLDKASESSTRHNPKKNRISLLFGDCLEHMNNMSDNSVHLIVTDPPYFIDGMGDSWNVDTLNTKRNKAGVVGSLPTGMKFDRKQGKALQAFYGRVAELALQVLCPGGFFLSFSSPRLSHRMAVAVEDAGFEIRDMYAWHHNKGQQKAFTLNHFVERMKTSTAEKNKIIAAMDGRKTPQLRPQFEPILVAQKPRQGTFVNNWTKWKTGLVDLSVRLEGKTPGTVLSVNKPTKDHYNSHLTVKPVELMEILIRLFSVEGQTVLDPFAGSGTTLLAARNTKRTGIGIEINEEYYEIAKKRTDMDK